MISSSPKEHALLKPSVRSFSLPNSGTAMVNGNLIPSGLMTVKDIVRFVVEGNDRGRFLNGSNVTDAFLQTGQTSVDRYRPCNEKIYAIQSELSKVSIFVENQNDILSIIFIKELFQVVEWMHMHNYSAFIFSAKKQQFH